MGGTPVREAGVGGLGSMTGVLQRAKERFATIGDATISATRLTTRGGS